MPLLFESRRMSSCRSVDGGQRPGATSAELAEIKSLKATVRRLEEDNAILKAAAVFFASTRPPQPLMMGFIDQMRAEGFAVESICRVLREQGCQVAARTLSPRRVWRQTCSSTPITFTSSTLICRSELG